MFEFVARTEIEGVGFAQRAAEHRGLLVDLRGQREGLADGLGFAWSVRVLDDESVVDVPFEGDLHLVLRILAQVFEPVPSRAPQCARRVRDAAMLGA